MELTDVVLTLAGLVTSSIILKNRSVTQPNWNKLPTLPEHLSLHPECVTADDENASCYACDSHKVLFSPLTGAGDYHLLHTCLACGKVLFRSRAIL
ncbi:hypothetical protein ACW5WQ_16000 [Aeromonas rivuli]|uniref:hypothetical protein n=1 Tax=Aeromonas rivuli TaxID=648794 RepID=UPI000693A6F1|nr:hypothetical protein [Aeromonas rivuli]